MKNFKNISSVCGQLIGMCYAVKSTHITRTMVPNITSHFLHPTLCEAHFKVEALCGRFLGTSQVSAADGHVLETLC